MTRSGPKRTTFLVFERFYTSFILVDLEIFKQMRIFVAINKHVEHSKHPKP